MLFCVSLMSLRVNFRIFSSYKIHCNVSVSILKVKTSLHLYREKMNICNAPFLVGVCFIPVIIVDFFLLGVLLPSLSSHVEDGVCPFLARCPNPIVFNYWPGQRSFL